MPAEPHGRSPLGGTLARRGGIAVVFAGLMTGEARAQEPADPRAEAAQVWRGPDETPAQGPRLDTQQLAAAQRVRARSMEERTSGLWQSWLVSICEGCGSERKPFFRGRGYRLAEREPAPARTVARDAKVGRTARVVRTAKREASVPDEGPSAYGDLSHDRIDRIRRQPVP